MNALIHAVEAGTVEEVRQRLAAGDAVDAADEQGRTPAFHATLRDRAEVLAVLLDAGARSDVPGEEACTLLHTGAAYGCPEVLRLLLDRGAPVDLPDAAGRTALMHAARRAPAQLLLPNAHFAEAVALLVARGANPNALDSAGLAALSQGDFASQYQGAELVELLLRAGADPNAGDSRPLVERLVMPRRFAADEQQAYAVLKRLLAAGLEPFRAPGALASATPRPEVIELLLDGRDPPQAQVDGALRMASLRLSPDGGAPIARSLRALAGARPSAAIVTEALRNVLTYAREWGGVDTGEVRVVDASVLDAVRALLGAGARPDAGTGLWLGRSALHAAARLQAPAERVVEILEVLVGAGAAIDCVDERGQTPLHLAVEAGLILNVRWLLERGAAPLHADAGGRTPLHAAVVGYEAAEAVDALLTVAPSVDVADGEGTTPLHLAVAAGALASVEKLLARGASPGMKDGQGQDTWALAAKDPLRRVLKLLERVAGPSPRPAPPQVATRPLVAAALRVGAQVVHTKFGVGTVEAIDKPGLNPTLRVRFGATVVTLQARYLAGVPLGA